MQVETCSPQELLVALQWGREKFSPGYYEFCFEVDGAEASLAYHTNNYRYQPERLSETRRSPSTVLGYQPVHEDGDGQQEDPPEVCQ